ncbi:MAG: hypothetical protein FRX48_06125 [Lasallia pustulata]|uniref:Uncharacterized protein n=1 Tax=Lasallia pustulata TaxID=136370 RepID=A0A5M8PQ83_9LECA|nr:MAG: hypothetical protein FRX48_06125 [Lasallia pustulata]
MHEDESIEMVETGEQIEQNPIPPAKQPLVTLSLFLNREPPNVFTVKQVCSCADAMLEEIELSHLHSCFLSIIRMCLFILDLLLRIPKFSRLETATYVDGAPASRAPSADLLLPLSFLRFQEQIFTYCIHSIIISATLRSVTAPPTVF